MLRDDEAGDYGLTETPTCFDHALIGTGDRILRKQDPCGGRVEERLDDDANAWPGEQADSLAVRDGGVRVRRPPDVTDGAGHISHRIDVEQRQVLAGETRRGAVFVNGRGSNRKWRL